MFNSLKHIIHLQTRVEIPIEQSLPSQRAVFMAHGDVRDIRTWYIGIGALEFIIEISETVLPIWLAKVVSRIELPSIQLLFSWPGQETTLVAFPVAASEDWIWISPWLCWKSKKRGGTVGTMSCWFVTKVKESPSWRMRWNIFCFVLSSKWKEWTNHRVDHICESLITPSG